MVDFRCRCGHRFSEPEDRCGRAVQCPDCRLLVDVPFPEDLAALEADGTLKLSSPPPPEPHRMDELQRVYGGQADLRSTPAQIVHAGGEAIPPVDERGQPPLPTPRYDPETGELIRPLDLAPPRPAPPQPVVPLGAVVHYARDGAHGGLHHPLLQLLMPANLLVMFFVAAMHGVALLAAGSILGLLAVPVAFFAIVAHYGAVIDDIGPEEHDELPRPLRDVRFWDDLWLPFCNVTAALMICYGPAAALAHPAAWVGGYPGLWAAVAAMAGTLLLPAVLLTLCASGSMANLRPDRLLGLIRACGWHYVQPCLAAGAAVGLYGLVTVGRPWLLGLPLPRMSAAGLARVSSVDGPLVALSTYAGHYLCWTLGMLYREHQARFPWPMRYHQRRYEREAALRREAAAARAPRAGDRPGRGRASGKQAGETGQ